MEKLVHTKMESVEMSTGNVFADLGFRNAEQHKIKAGLAIEITLAIQRLGLNQQAAAKIMGISQAKISGMMRGNFLNLSEQKLMTCLNRLGYDIQITL